MYQQNLFENKVALVTGGRSGIGFAIAGLYLRLGARVVISSRREDELQEAAEELSEHGDCRCLPCDIRDPDQVQALADFIGQEHGWLDILVNNAGGQFPSPAEAIKPKGWDAVVNNNLNGTFYVTQQMAKTFFMPQQHGVIVNIIANIYRGFPGMAHTGAARAGVENLTKTLAQEWAGHNIRINSIAPGIIESSGLDTYPDIMKRFFDAAREANLMKRFGTPEDVANAVMFYSSPLSSYVTGTTLYVDGADHLAAPSLQMVQALQKLAGG